MTQPRADAATTGSLTVITGSMFSGKTEELIRRLRRSLYARRSIQAFKHALDTRSELTEIRTHNGVLHEAVAVSTSDELLEKLDETTDVVAVEETQFFDEGIAGVCRRLIDGKPAPASAPTILVGAQESYEARCRHCHEV